MSSASTLRAQIEAALADRIPSALTPVPRTIHPVAPVGISSVDALLQGGLPIGAITEIVGPDCSGRTSLALSFLAHTTQAGKVCAWIDVSDSLDPESAAFHGVQLNELLWVRCGASTSDSTQSKHNNFAVPDRYLIPQPGIRGLHGGGCGPHPREEAKGLSNAVGDFLHPSITAPRCAEPKHRVPHETPRLAPSAPPLKLQQANNFNLHGSSFAREQSYNDKLWLRIDQALRVTDLLLQAGGFAAIVLDMAAVAPQHASRVPLATWFRYRAAVERSQACLLLLTQHACAKSSAGLLLRLGQADIRRDEPSVLTCTQYSLEVARERFQPSPNILPLRKPPHSERIARWQSRHPWAGSV